MYKLYPIFYQVIPLTIKIRVLRSVEIIYTAMKKKKAHNRKNNTLW